MSRLTDALAITYQMLVFSNDGDWVKVIEAQEKRDQLFTHMDDSTFSLSDDDEKLIQEILNINRQLTSQANVEKERCLHLHASLKYGKKAQKAYSVG